MCVCPARSLPIMLEVNDPKIMIQRARQHRSPLDAAINDLVNAAGTKAYEPGAPESTS